MASPAPHQAIDSLLKAGQVFDPPPGFRERAWVKGDELHRHAEGDPGAFGAP